MKKEFLLLLIFFVVAIAIRLYRIDQPLADWHSFRQSDTAAVARNFEKFGFDPLHPRGIDLSNIQSGKDNLMGWRMLEFPLYQSVGHGLKKLVPSLSWEITLRLVTISASSLTALLLGVMVSRTVESFSGYITFFSFAIIPYSIYFGRTILPEPFMVFWAVLSVFLLSRGLFLLSAFCAAISLLVKPTAVFLLFPIPYLIFRNYSFSPSFLIRLFAYSLIALLPLWGWRRWILQFSEGIPVYTWLLNEGNIRLKGAWFYWVFAERLGKLILGYWGLVPFSLGFLIAPSKKEGWLFRLWVIGALAYVVIVARGNVQHDYYQILLLPVISVYLGKGFAFLLSHSVFSQAIRYTLFAIIFLFMFAFSWYTIRTYYWINRPEIVEAGREADRLLPAEAKVIAPYNGDTTFLYQINRQGWPLGFDIDKKIQMGATHYVTVSSTNSDLETKDLAQKYTIILRNDKFAIIDLTKPKQ